MITVAETQQGAIAAELQKRRKRERTGADDVADGMLDEMEAETGPGVVAAGADEAEAVKTTVAEEGPGTCMEPGPVEPEQYDRPYLEQGHAAESPQAEGPRSNPLPGLTHYLPPSEPMTARIHPAVIAAYTGGSPSGR